MNFKRMSSILARQLFLMRASPARILPMFAWVGVDILLWGFITRYLSSVANNGLNFVGTLLGAVLLWDFFTRVMFGMTQAFFEDVWARNFLNLFASPMTITEYITGLVLSSVVTSLLGLVFMLILASACFGLSMLAYGAMVIPFFLVLFLFGVSLGIVGISMVLRFGPAAEWLIWPIPALVSPLAGVFYPVSTLPHWMQWSARLLPPSYVFESLRAIASGRHTTAMGPMIGAALCFAYLLAACWIFMRVFKHSVRSGLIARYSAETLS